MSSGNVKVHGFNPINSSTQDRNSHLEIPGLRVIMLAVDFHPIFSETVGTMRIVPHSVSDKNYSEERILQRLEECTSHRWRLGEFDQNGAASYEYSIAI